ncbi:hypothetical protein H6P81_013375 [Aristolochia fimbriata]|uniref:Reverse transcriptase RNase H-like domain-containing protein n=1 Tax=Aristolochia fimbriata TaxID=158543 RepID=A0AAV7EEI7_ARIFI|nr:hypothetical protein H6P81_013375 [Aristolochia fimbriata]
MVDATTGHEALSFIDGSSGYNQILMDPKDKEMTAFRTPKAGRFLRFIVRHSGIEIDQTKIDTVKQMREPKNLSELKSLQGHLAYVRPFISNLARICQPFSRLMKKDTPFECDESCRRAFQNIKDYLMKPPVLTTPMPGKPLLLYIAAQEKSLGALLAQNDDQGKERALYYLSHTMVGAEQNYSPIEKTCLALIFVVEKLRHYLLAHSTNLISRGDPLKYIMSRLMLSGRLTKWALLLSEFDINVIPQKVVKGQEDPKLYFQVKQLGYYWPTMLRMLWN